MKSGKKLLSQSTIFAAKNLSVFFPCFNEEENIKNTVDQAVSVLNKLGIQYEIILVDDGSKDRTGVIADGLAKQNERIKVVHHEKNLGYGSALKTGFHHAKYEWVAFADSDGQFNFNEITLLLEKTDKADLILGYRLKRADSILRKIYTFGWAMIAKILLGLRARDYSCGFKLIKKEVFESVQPLEGEEKVTQIEFLVKARRLGYRFAEVGVHHYPRKFGQPTGSKISVVLKSMLDLFKLWWKIQPNKQGLLLLAGILLMAVFFRLYRLPEYMTFLGDEGRDALIIKKILTEGDIPFIGPPTSVGNIYLGPLYYYMMALSMVIFWLNPVAAAGMVALLGIASVALVYLCGKWWFGDRVGLIAAFLYAISPVTITYSRSSWNPNPAPFIALLGIVTLYQAHKTRNGIWFILTGALTAAAIQMHYLALILLPVYGLISLADIKSWLLGDYKNFIKGLCGGTVAFILIMMPLILFDFNHNFLNWRALNELFANKEAVNAQSVNILLKSTSLYTDNLVGRYITRENYLISLIVALVILLPLIILIKNYLFKKSFNWSVYALSVWLYGGIIGLSLYRHPVYDHYLGFLNPAPFLLLSFGLTTVGNWLRNRLVVLETLFMVVLIGYLGYINLISNPLLLPPNKQLERTQKVARFIIEKAEGQPFNFALIAKSNYDAAYQFYLEIYGHKPPQVPFIITDQLFVVCEDVICDPIYSPKYEIAAFGWVKVDSEYQVEGLKLYKLVHNPDGKP